MVDRPERDIRTLLEDMVANDSIELTEGELKTLVKFIQCVKNKLRNIGGK